MSRSTLPTTVRRRVTVAAALAVVASVALTGCQNKAGTAAFVGGHRITDQDLRRSVDAVLGDPEVKKVVDSSLGDDLATLRRVVLDNEVQHLLVTEAAARLHASVPSGAVDARMSQLAQQAGGAENIDALFARSGLTPELGRRVVRDEALLTEIGYASGAKRADDAELRRAYDAARAQFTTMTLGIVQTPDAATGQSVLDQIRRDPKSFPGLAAKYPQGATTAQPQQVPAANVNPELLSKLNPVRPGDGILFTQQAQGSALFAVIFLVNRQVTPFESVRSQLAADTISKADSAAGSYLATLAKDLRVRVNPRYGKWDYGQNHIAELPDPLVKLPSATKSNAAAAPPDQGNAVPPTGPSN